MKQSPDNQINASFIDISRIKWLVLLLRSSFFSTTRPLASSEATAYYRPAPGRTDGIPERYGYKSVLTNSWLVRQRHSSWIKGLGKNPQKEWTRSLLAVPFVQGHPTVTPGTPRNDGVYTRQSPWWHATPRHAWRVYKSSGKTHKNCNACIDAHRSSVRPNKNLRVYKASDANWLTR